MLFKPIDLTAAQQSAEVRSRRLAQIDEGLARVRAAAAQLTAAGITPAETSFGADEIAGLGGVDGSPTVAASLEETMSRLTALREAVAASSDRWDTKRIELTRAEHREAQALKRAIKIAFWIFGAIALLIMIRSCGGHGR